MSHELEKSKPKGRFRACKMDRNTANKSRMTSKHQEKGRFLGPHHAQALRFLRYLLHTDHTAPLGGVAPGADAPGPGGTLPHHVASFATVETHLRRLLLLLLGHQKASQVMATYGAPPPSAARAVMTFTSQVILKVSSSFVPLATSKSTAPSPVTSRHLQEASKKSSRSPGKAKGQLPGAALACA